MQISTNLWLSNFFQRSIYELEQIQLSEINQLDFTEGSLVQIKLPCSEKIHIQTLQQYGFSLVDGEVIFEYDLLNYSPIPITCRIATVEDLTKLIPFSNLFPETRFRSPWFSLDENRRFYLQWIINAVKGEFDDICLVSETTHGEIQGIISLRIKKNIAYIGLLAVAEKWQRQGVGYQLLRNAIQWANSHQAKKMMITTQLSNLPAIQLYQRLNGKISETYYWFYR